MKILVAYATKSGVTKMCANMLADRLEEFADVVVCNLDGYDPDTMDYDCIVVGSSIRMGKIQKKARRYLAKNRVYLRAKPFAFFICNVYEDDSKNYIHRNLYQDLDSRAIVTDSFGGELNPENLHGSEIVAVKMLIKNVEKEGLDVKINEKAIDNFAKQIKIELKKSKKKKK